MLIQFTLQDLMLFFVYGLGIVAGILLLPILWDIKKMVGSLRSLVETNHDTINKSIRTMPGILENLGQTSSNIRETTDQLKLSVPVILREVEFVTSATKGNIQLASAVMENIGFGVNETIAVSKKDISGIMDYIHIFEEVLQIIYRTFSSRK